MVEIRLYRDRLGRSPFADWFEKLADQRARAKIDIRVARLAAGNPGDVESVGEGVMELRIDWGPGYRVYFGRLGDVVALLLCAGDKRTQNKDIEDAKRFWKDFKARTKQGRPR